MFAGLSIYEELTIVYLTTQFTSSSGDLTEHDTEILRKLKWNKYHVFYFKLQYSNYYSSNSFNTDHERNWSITYNFFTSYKYIRFTNNFTKYTKN